MKTGEVSQTQSVSSTVSRKMLKLSQTKDRQFAGWGQRHRSAATVEQPDAVLRLEGLDATAQRRLRDAFFLSGE